MASPKAAPQGRTYAGVTEAERKAERRERFLAAGLEVFGSAGYRAGTVRVLCKAAGLTDRYFYESFDDTEALLQAVYEQQMAALRTQLLTELPNFPTEKGARIRAGLKLFFAAMRDPRVARVALVEVVGISSRMDAVHKANTRAYGDFIVQLIRTELPGVKLEPDLAQVVSMAFVGACFMAATQWMLGRYRISQGVMVEGCTLVALGTLRELATRR